MYIPSLDPSAIVSSELSSLRNFVLLSIYCLHEERRFLSYFDVTFFLLLEYLY